MEGEHGPKNYVATLDIGTSSVRCIVINKEGDHVGTSSKSVTLLYPKPGWVEIDPEQLWQAVVDVVKSAIKGAGLEPKDISCLGISTQRCTIITWDKTSGKHFHNFITWTDLRADSLVRQHNDSYLTKSIRIGARLAYYITWKDRFYAGSDLKAMNEQIVCRLEWVLRTMPEVKEAAQRGSAVYGMLDSWLLYRLTGGRLHVSDVSCASASGLFDPFNMQYDSTLTWIYSIPATMLPTVCDSAGQHFTSTSAEIFGHSIPIRSSIADQSASLFASCCFNKGDVKATLGTGTFLDVNTGNHPHASTSGLYPVVGWRVRDDLVYMAEGSSSDTASLVQWLQRMNMTPSPESTADIASSVSDTDGVYFVPSFSGIKVPVNDSQAASGFIGVKPTTTPAHLVRAVLESIALRVAQIYSVLIKETTYKPATIRVDGGVASNDFIAQMVADLTGVRVERADSVEMSARGAAYLAGISAGVWKDKEEILKLRRVDKTFTAKETGEWQPVLLREWNRALSRFLAWYK